MFARRWLSPAEAAGVLGLSRRTVYRGLRVGSLPGGKIGGVWRLDRLALEAALEGQSAARRRVVRG